MQNVRCCLDTNAEGTHFEMRQHHCVRHLGAMVSLIFYLLESVSFRLHALTFQWVLEYAI